MTQYSTLIAKLSNSQLNKLKSGIKNVFHQMQLAILMIN